jgi:hypothetical protein
MVLPQAVLAAPPAPSAPDVALEAGGLMVGQVVDAQGAPRAGAPVVIQQKGVEVARTVADGQGRFAFSGVRGGVYHLVTSNGQAMYRCWAEGTAPPVAQQGALLVAGDVVRGQCGSCGTDPCACGGGGGLFGGGWLSNPWVLAAIVATAIAVPIAVSDNDDGS